MASSAEMRAWGRDNGWTVSDKGPLSPRLKNAYNAAHNGEPDRPGQSDYPAGMSDQDFELAEAITPDDDFPDETPPRPVPKAGPSSIPTKLQERLRPGKTRGSRKTKAKRPRVSTAELIGSGWRIGARLAQPLPPMYRTLRLQSVIAGPLLDDAVKDTMVDPFLQPLARLTKTGETVSALVAPNLAIGAMAYHLNATKGEPNPVVMQVCQEMLRHGLIAMMKVGGDAFAHQLAQEREDEERYGGSVEMIMEWLLSAPADPSTEEANIAGMAARFAGQDVPEPEPETMPV